MFKVSHTILDKATDTDYGYEVIDIDINSGLFKRKIVKSSNTSIRVNQEIFGETTRGRMLTAEVKDITHKFNEVRKQKGFEPVVFRCLEEANERQ